MVTVALVAMALAAFLTSPCHAQGLRVDAEDAQHFGGMASFSAAECQIFGSAFWRATADGGIEIDITAHSTSGPCRMGPGANVVSLLAHAEGGALHYQASATDEPFYLRVEPGDPTLQLGLYAPQEPERRRVWTEITFTSAPWGQQQLHLSVRPLRRTLPSRPRR